MQEANNNHARKILTWQTLSSAVHVHVLFAWNSILRI
jgi:hypothetical protein